MRRTPPLLVLAAAAGIVAAPGVATASSLGPNAEPVPTLDSWAAPAPAPRPPEPPVAEPPIPQPAADELPVSEAPPRATAATAVGEAVPSPEPTVTGADAVAPDAVPGAEPSAADPGDRAGAAGEEVEVAAPAAAPPAAAASGRRAVGVFKGIGFALFATGQICFSGGPITLILCGAAITEFFPAYLGILAFSGVVGAIVASPDLPRAAPAADTTPTAVSSPPEPAAASGEVEKAPFTL